MLLETILGKVRTEMRESSTHLSNSDDRDYARVMNEAFATLPAPVLVESALFKNTGKTDYLMMEKGSDSYIFVKQGNKIEGIGMVDGEATKIAVSSAGELKTLKKQLENEGFVTIKNDRQAKKLIKKSAKGIVGFIRRHGLKILIGGALVALVLAFASPSVLPMVMRYASMIKIGSVASAPIADAATGMMALDIEDPSMTDDVESSGEVDNGEVEQLKLKRDAILSTSDMSDPVSQAAYNTVAAELADAELAQTYDTGLNADNASAYQSLDTVRNDATERMNDANDRADQLEAERDELVASSDMSDPATQDAYRQASVDLSRARLEAQQAQQDLQNSVNAATALQTVELQQAAEAEASAAAEVEYNRAKDAALALYADERTAERMAVQAAEDEYKRAEAEAIARYSDEQATQAEITGAQQQALDNAANVNQQAYAAADAEAKQADEAVVQAKAEQDRLRSELDPTNPAQMALYTQAARATATAISAANSKRQEAERITMQSQ